MAAAIVCVPVLLPPEVHAWSLPLCAGLAIAALGVVAVSARGRCRATGGLWPLAPLAAAAILLAPSRARAIDEAAAFAVLLCIGLGGATLSRETRAVGVVVAALAAVGTIAAVQAILQHHLFYPRQVEILLANRDPAADPLLMRFAAGRPAGPFILPSVLGAFLAMALPSLCALAGRARGLAARGAGLAALLLQGYALLLTRSFGAILAAAVAGMLMLPLLSRPKRRLAAAALVVALLAAGGYFLHARRAEIGHAPGSDPVSLRLGNWRAAAGMIADHPAFGVGPGSFGTSYTLYLREGMNETRHAHNAYFEIVASWGAWAVVPLGLLLFGCARAARRLATEGGPRLPLAAGGAAFLAHNFIDFGAYLPGLAIPGALLVGMMLGAEPGETEAPGRAPGGAALRAAVASLAALLLCAAIVPQTRARLLLEQARDAALAGDAERAAGLARAAAGARPADPDAWSFLAEMTLVHWRDDPERFRKGEDASLRAVRLDPQSAFRHYTRSLYHRESGAGAAAFLELSTARRLYPLKALYRLPGATAAMEER
jgi:hypothetical protein